MRVFDVCPYQPSARRGYQPTALPERAVLPDADRGVPLASPVHRPQRRLRRDRGVPREVPPRATALGARVSHAEGVRGDTSASCTETRGTLQTARPFGGNAKQATSASSPPLVRLSSEVLPAFRRSDIGSSWAASPDHRDRSNGP